MEESQNKEISAPLFSKLVSYIEQGELDCLNCYMVREIWEIIKPILILFLNTA